MTACDADSSAPSSLLPELTAPRGHTSSPVPTCRECYRSYLSLITASKLSVNSAGCIVQERHLHGSDTHTHKGKEGIFRLAGPIAATQGSTHQWLQLKTFLNFLPRRAAMICTIILKATITTYSSQKLLTHNLELRHRPCLFVSWD